MENKPNFDLSKDYNEVSKEIMKTIKQILMFIDNLDKVEHYDINLQLDVILINLQLTREILEHNQKIISKSPHKDYKLHVFYDYLLHKFKTLREKYEEVDLIYFSLDEENTFLETIRNSIEIKNSEINQVSLIYLRIYLFTLLKMKKRLESLINKEIDVDKLTKCINKIRLLTKSCIRYIFKAKDLTFLKNMIGDKKWNMFSPNEDGLIQAIPTSFSSYISNYLNSSSIANVLTFAKTRLSQLVNSNSDKEIWKNFFDSLETSSFITKSSENVKTNELFYIENNFDPDDFKLFTLRNLRRKIKEDIFSKYTQIRLITNNIFFPITKRQNLTKNIFNNKKETNFFGLLLKISKEYIYPQYNLLIHIHGGSHFNQTSESHLFYLNEWARRSNSIIISIDLKDTSKSYVAIIEKLLKIVNLIVMHSKNIFNFSINNLVFCGESIGCMLLFQLLRIQSKWTIPYSLLLLCPLLWKDELIVSDKYENNVIDHLEEYSKEDLIELLDFPVDNILNVSIISSMNEPIINNSEKIKDQLSHKLVKVNLYNSLSYYFGYPNISLIENKISLFIDEGIKFLNENFSKKFRLSTQKTTTDETSTDS